MELKSPAFKDSQYIPRKYTCEGDDCNPALEVKNVPANTQSLLLIINDPDAPNGDWVHWLVWNIDPQIGEIEKDSVPAGATEGVTSFGKPGYRGPCPAIGTHVYIFKLYALDTQLPAEPSWKKREIKEMIEGHVLDKAMLKGFYERESLI